LHAVPTSHRRVENGRVESAVRRWRFCIALAIVSCAGLESLGCAPEARPQGRALLIGIDGATLRLAVPLMQQGRLPNLSKIAANGVYGPLRSVQPLLSPRIWNSIATGMTAEQHGIVNFARKREDGTQQLLLSTDRRVPALWNIASNAGLTVAVVNWWNTFPPDRVQGVIVSDHLFAREIEGRQKLSGATSTPSGAVAFPLDWQPRLAALVANETPPVDFANPFAGIENLPAWLKPEPLTRRFREDGAVARFALEVEAEIEPDLLMVLLTGIDRISHFLWLGVEPPETYPERLRVSEVERTAAATALKRYYEYTDALIGALVERYADDDLVMVVSDHGFEGGQGLAFLTGVHETRKALDGVIFARGNSIASGQLRGGVGIYDVTPTILAWLGLPVARDLEGAVAPFLEVSPVARIATYADEPIERVNTGPSGADDALIEQLRTLGYLE
jgi:predicted AlkP superfamily pyrophosphatase or phosphodiesterase